MNEMKQLMTELTDRLRKTNEARSGALCENRRLQTTKSMDPDAGGRGFYSGE